MWMKVRSFVHLISPFLSSTATPPLFTVSALSTLFLRTESVSVTQVNQIIKKYVLKLSIVLSYCVVRQHPAEIVELPNEMNKRSLKVHMLGFRKYHSICVEIATCTYQRIQLES